MTDNDIIKALECCSKDDVDCEKCPANCLCDNDNFCFTGAILDLINRQQAEIEQLKRIGFADKLFFKRIRINAVKEFADRLNKEAEKVAIDQEGDFVTSNDKIYDTVADWCKATSDNLLKEM